MRVLLIHANLIVDGNKSFEDGALLINGEHIEEVFPHSNKIKYDLTDVEKINVKGLKIIPDFYYEDINKKFILDPLNNESKLLANMFKEKSKILLGKTEAKLKDVKDIEYDGFYDLYENMTGFCHKDLGLVNLAFYQRDKYVELNPNIIDASVLKFTIDNLRKDRVILIGDLVSGIKRLRKLHYSFNDILLMSSLNGYTFYDENKLCGSLVKGKYANLQCVDDEGKIIFKFNKGKLHV